MQHTLYFTFSLLILLLQLDKVLGDTHYGSLWCIGGGQKNFAPLQCEQDTIECFKFRCEGIDAGFVARGCGVSLPATGLVNESCHQAMGVCQTLGGTSYCDACRDKHMCNGSFGTTSYLFGFVFTLIVVLG